MDSVEMELKVCKVCELEKPLTEFYTQNKTRKDGTEYIYYRPDCKECTQNKSMKWAKDNIERHRQLQKKSNSTPRVRELRRGYSKRQRDSGYTKSYYHKNKEQLREYNKNKLMNKTHKISNEEWENCKNYFNYRCAYCGLAIENHYIKFNGEIRLGDFAREHVDDEGVNDLSNCVPSCKSCNSQKSTFTLEEWLDINARGFNEQKYNKIIKWISEDFMKYIESVHVDEII
ncbi:endonuclease [Peribacillus asahii]|uniref:Endonuclease n=1 Tax=Peribacillus asahii TaxID=228899 RepID=A0A3T0KT09_9BACI|nr:HNH endonuclease signature motif containing protein [Peribacillus asahii]AZV43582.1 endonuclease [Peribacillus asahii]